MENKVDIKHGFAYTESFAKVYPMINDGIMASASDQSSRAGNTKEVLNFKTHITNPYRRCVGGQGRDINIFFLLAEAMWIAVGRKDVKFLTMFNKRMEDFSDDGVVGPLTIGAINRADPLTLFNTLWASREAHFLKIVTNNASQQVFLKGWLNRLGGIKFGSLVCNGGKVIDFNE